MERRQRCGRYVPSHVSTFSLGPFLHLRTTNTVALTCISTASIAAVCFITSKLLPHLKDIRDVVTWYKQGSIVVASSTEAKLPSSFFFPSPVGAIEFILVDEFDCEIDSSFESVRAVPAGQTQDQAIEKLLETNPVRRVFLEHFRNI